jgi:hypothetical protein
MQGKARLGTGGGLGAVGEGRIEEEQRLGMDGSGPQGRENQGRQTCDVGHPHPVSPL